MSFYINKDKNWYLGDTCIENIFINEYMTGAPGEYVKVYMFARMHASLGGELTNSMIAMELSCDEEDVLKAWTYWESRGVIRKHYPDVLDKFRYDVEFLSLKNGNFSIPKEEEEEKEEEDSSDENYRIDENLRGLFMAIEQMLGRTLNPTECREAGNWMNELDADPEVILCAYRQAQQIGKVSTKYVGGIVKNWVGEGLKSAEDVENHLNDTNERRYLYRKVFKSLGFDRKWTEKEKKLMDRWFDEYGFTLDRVLEACDKSSGISNPNINYVDAVLTNWNKESVESGTGEQTSKKISNSQVLKYYEHIREEEEREVLKRRNEVFKRVPEIQAVEEKIQNLNLEMTRTMFAEPGEKRTAKVEEIKKEIESLTVEKMFLLTDNDFRTDYMDIRYRCDICQDTGVTQDGARCDCFKERAEEAIIWQKTQK